MIRPIRKLEQVQESQMKQYVRTFQLKQLTLLQIFEIYKKYALTPYFENTMKSAILLIFLPAFTNIYYTFRPSSIFAKFMPYVIPIACIGQYTFAFYNDINNFCYVQQTDSKMLRQKYKLLYLYTASKTRLDIMIDNFTEFQEKKKIQKQIN